MLLIEVDTTLLQHDKNITSSHDRCDDLTASGSSRDQYLYQQISNVENLILCWNNIVHCCNQSDLQSVIRNVMQKTITCTDKDIFLFYRDVVSVSLKLILAGDLFFLDRLK